MIARFQQWKTGVAALTAIDRIGQQNIPRHATPETVSGINIEHTADHDWTRPVHRTATRGDTIDGAILALGIHIPHNVPAVTAIPGIVLSGGIDGHLRA
jgi:hypothetical protein